MSCGARPASVLRSSARPERNGAWYFPEQRRYAHPWHSQQVSLRADGQVPASLRPAPVANASLGRRTIQRAGLQRCTGGLQRCTGEQRPMRVIAVPARSRIAARCCPPGRCPPNDITTVCCHGSGCTLPSHLSVCLLLHSCQPQYMHRLL